MGWWKVGEEEGTVMMGWSRDDRTVIKIWRLDSGSLPFFLSLALRWLGYHVVIEKP